VADIASHVDAQVATNRAGSRLGRLGSTEHDAARLDGVGTFPHQAAHGSTAHVVNEASEEALGGQIGIVLLKQLARRCHELERLQLEALLLESTNNLPDQSSLNAIRLDHNVGALHVSLKCRHTLLVFGVCACV